MLWMFTVLGFLDVDRAGADAAGEEAREHREYKQHLCVARHPRNARLLHLQGRRRQLHALHGRRIGPEVQGKC